MEPLLPKVNSPHDIKNFDIPQLSQLSREIREYIIKTVSKTGGHLAPSLGVVELTLVLHHLFDTPRDKIIWDVGHQAYAHKIITGRRDKFDTIRQYNGISGFPKILESEYDAFGVGHASTAISSAYGMACARDLAGDNYKVIAVVGDGALTGGLSFEGLNNAGGSNSDLIVVVNDNSMSISPNVGAISKYLTNIISNPLYNRIKSDIWDLTGKLSTAGSHIRRGVKRIQDALKSFVIPGLLFERMGFRYFGPVDGHNIAGLIRLFREVQRLHGPIVIHVLTKKGKGYEPAEKNASVFHGLGKFDLETGNIIKKSEIPTFTSIFGKTIVELAEKNEKIVAITGAMALGTGLSEFSQKFPSRFFDVGIAEAHAVTFAAGMAVQGYKPVVAIYSSFLQRGFDQIIHDVTLQNLPVIFALDRAGLVGDDGPTHHGVFDLAYLRTIPGLVIMAPMDEEELRHMLWTAVQYRGPIAIRYPRGFGEGVQLSKTYQTLPIGISKVLRSGADLAIIAAGNMTYRALEAADTLAIRDKLSVEVINARFIKPIDTEMLTRVASKFKLVLTLEEGTIKGGLGSEVAEYFADRNIFSVELIRCGLPDSFIEQGEKELLLNQIGLDAEGIVHRIRNSKTYEHLEKMNLIKINKQ
ncbi:1-deoxy-D-xylulose-5-phosphate synthase [candidate division KSB1 bacterium]|nr:1-deoxy-D-xylulose-5-phosphate synthase [candidate division KSB1 bacterium]